MDAPQEFGHVVRLKNVPAKEHSGCTRLHNRADSTESYFLVRSGAAAAK